MEQYLLLPYTVGVQLVSQHHLTFIQLIIFYLIYRGIFQDLICTAIKKWSSSPAPAGYSWCTADWPASPDLHSGDHILPDILYRGIFQDMLCAADRQWISSPAPAIQLISQHHLSFSQLIIFYPVYGNFSTGLTDKSVKFAIFIKNGTFFS